MKILSTKLKCWSGEHEYRFITESEDVCELQIGKITGVFFGMPYSDIGNAADVRMSSKSLREYLGRVGNLHDVAKCEEIPCFKVKIVGNAVEFEELQSATPFRKDTTPSQGH